MARIKINRRGQRRLKALYRKISRLTGSYCEIAPTDVMLELSHRKGRKLLAKQKNTHSAQVRRRILKKARPIFARVAQEKQISRARLAKFWRYSAYVDIERGAWPSARDGAWGGVDEETQERKRRDAAAGRAFAAEARERARAARSGTAYPWWSRSKRGRGGGKQIPNYGVRAIDQARKWYQIQKGKRPIGLDDRPGHSREHGLIRVRFHAPARSR